MANLVLRDIITDLVSAKCRHAESFVSIPHFNSRITRGWYHYNNV